jgi:hypothetical protein
MFFVFQFIYNFTPVVPAGNLNGGKPANRADSD